MNKGQNAMVWHERFLMGSLVNMCDVCTVDNLRTEGVVLVRVTVAVINPMTKAARGGTGFRLPLRPHCSSSKGVGTGTQAGQDSRGRS